ncbi:MAG: c-type cytochrome [Bacteroidia bacterium]|nr:c-type cytochrome [Bacteroidia bacterium]
MSIKTKYLQAIFLVVLLFSSCQKLGPKAPKDDEILDGPIEGLSAEERALFLKGDVAFNNDVFSAATGLGPVFVSTSCGSCHAGDGRGHPFTSLTRFGQTDSTGNQFLALGGPQLQNRALPGYKPETLPAGASSSKILPPPNTGLGLIDAIDDADILALADPYDLNGDGISGIPNWIHAPAYCEYRNHVVEQNGKYMGRFGRKGAAYDLLQQTANAYNQDMGINSSFEPIDTYSKKEIDPEISNATIHAVVFYLRTLKAPVQRDQQKTEVQSGKKVFSDIGCASCHHPEFKTGNSPIAALSNKVFYPYTDLLLHDMGKDLDDGYTEGSAKTFEWKTPALWGLGLSKNSQGGQYYLMHDGRANSIEEAINLHGGEAAGVRTKYRALSENDKNNLITFLESL